MTLDGDNWAHLEPQVTSFLESLPVRDSAERLAAGSRTLPANDEGLAIPAQINYVGKAANLYDLGYTQHGSILAITNYSAPAGCGTRSAPRAAPTAPSARLAGSRACSPFSPIGTRTWPNTLGQPSPGPPSSCAPAAIDEAELTKTIIGAMRELDRLPAARRQGLVVAGALPAG